MQGMIDYINGIVTNTLSDRVVIATGPFGLSLYMPNAGALVIGQVVTVYIYMHWNQDSGPTFFGFMQDGERQLFSLIIGCSGVGPKIAIAILSDMTPVLFIKAIQEGDIDKLSTISGIGQKKAEHLLLYLKHKIAKFIDSGIDFGGDRADNQLVREVVAVLKSLNYSKAEVSDALKYLQEHHANQQLSFDHLIRHALAFLSKKV
jgi:Holliday junction DNA helicase RuvA